MAQRIKTFNGITLARLKTWNGVAKARVKTWNGIDNTSLGGSYVLKDSNETDNSDNLLGFTTAFLYISSLFQAGSIYGLSYTLTKASLKLLREGSASHTITAYIYSDNGSDLPDSLLGTSTNTVTHSTLATSPGDWVDFTFAGVSLTSDEKYHIAASISVDDASNFARWKLDAFATGNNSGRSSDGSTWNTLAANYKMCFKTYATE